MELIDHEFEDEHHGFLFCKLYEYRELKFEIEYWHTLFFVIYSIGLIIITNNNVDLHFFIFSQI